MPVQVPSVALPQYAVVATSIHGHRCLRCGSMGGGPSPVRPCFGNAGCDQLLNNKFPECMNCHPDFVHGLMQTWNSTLPSLQRINWLLSFGNQCPTCKCWGVLVPFSTGTRRCSGCGFKAFLAFTAWGTQAWMAVPSTGNTTQQAPGAAPAGPPTCNCNPCSGQMS